MNSQEHSRMIDGVWYIWKVSQLWELSKHLPIFQFNVSTYNLDIVRWFAEGEQPTAKSILQHCKRINEADLSCSLIFAPDGCLMDGLHRICKAMINNVSYLPAVQFTSMPEPNLIETPQPILINDGKQN